MRPTLTLLSLIWLALACVAVPAEGFNWETATPESQGMSSEKLETLKENLAAANSRAFLVIRDDKIVCEWYPEGRSATDRHFTASLAKALAGGMSLAVAIHDGLIELDDPVSKYVPQWKDGYRKPNITIRHLGSHTSGLEDTEQPGLSHQQLEGWKGDFWKRLDPPRDPFTLSRDNAGVLFEPGTDYHYSNPGIGMLTYCVTASLNGRKHSDIRTLLRERIMRPIGAADAEWSIGYGTTYAVDGLPMVASWGGGSFTPRAAARIGRLVLREGDWDGQRLLTKEAVRQVTGSAGLPGARGMGWLTNADGVYPKLPRDAIWGAGAQDQILLIVPSLDLIMVRNGGWLGTLPSGSPDRTARVRILFEPLIAAVTDAKERASEADPPYPASDVITDISFGDYATYTPDRAGDNWPITWGDDGHLYTTWGDGQGPDHPEDERISMGFARVEGDPPDVKVIKIDSPDEQSGDGRSGRKASGLLMIDGLLYMWVRNDNQRGEHCRLWWSTDRGENWTQADWNFEEGGYLTFVNFGQDYQETRDDFVYSVSHNTPSAYDYADDFILMRVPKNQITNRAGYEFFQGMDGEGNPNWTSNIAERGSVFHHPGRCQRSSISYNAVLGRYLWWQSGWPNPDGQDSRFHDSPLGIYEAPEPWGPWRTVFYSESFPKPGETGCFPTKWMGPLMEGRQTVHMLTSTDDAFSIYPVTLTIKD